MLRTIESQLLAMPTTMRCLLLQQTVYQQPAQLCRRCLSTSAADLYPRQRSMIPSSVTPSNEPRTKSPKTSRTAQRPDKPAKISRSTQTPPKKTTTPSKTWGPREPREERAPRRNPFRPSRPPTFETTAPAVPHKKQKKFIPAPPKDPLVRSQSMVPLSYLPPPSNNPDTTPVPSPEVSPALLTSTTTLLTDPPPRFLYSAPRFLNMPINTRIPEICLLGRSNVGKSTLINALAGISSAGRSHGSTVSSARKQTGSLRGLAITSAKAGCTRTLNGYAFGIGRSKKETRPPARPETKGPKTRSERREAQSRNRDKTPNAAMILLDLPGYGMNSQASWGAEIAKYLARRQQLRGAVLLVDAIAGLKEGDRQVLRILRDTGIRTAVFLTKADKLGYGTTYTGDEKVGRMCAEVWGEMRRIERKGAEVWVEGGEKGWEREIWVTGAGDPKKGGGVGVDGARFAIARLAGLVEDGRDLEGVGVTKGVVEQRVVPFEQLVWGPAKGGEAGRGVRATF